MAESISGMWKIKDSENFGGYLQALGVQLVNENVMEYFKPILTIEINGNTFFLKNETTIRTIEIRCTIGEEFDEELGDGRKCRSIMHWKGNALLHLQTWEGGNFCETARYREGDFLIVKFEMGKTVAKLIYERIRFHMT